MAPDRVDLHAHTNVSDGTDSPEALARLAADAGLAAIAVTDHDHVGGVAACARAAEPLGVEVVPGVELSVETPRGQLHLLGYFVDTEDTAFLDTLARVREGRGPRNAAIVEKLNALGVDVTMADVEAEAGATPGKSVGRPHVAAALVSKGHVASIQEAFDRYLADGRPAHVPKPKLAPAEAVRAVRAAGGVPVVAHPVTLPAEERRDIIERLADEGLQGLEVVHPKQDAETRAEIAALARGLDLVITGGTDYHGANKPGVHLGWGVNGNVHVTTETLDAVRARRRG